MGNASRGAGAGRAGDAYGASTFKVSTCSSELLSQSEFELATKRVHKSRFVNEGRLPLGTADPLTRIEQIVGFERDPRIPQPGCCPEFAEVGEQFQVHHGERREGQGIAIRTDQPRSVLPCG